MSLWTVMLVNHEPAARPQERNELLHQLNAKRMMERFMIALALTSIAPNPAVLGIARTSLECWSTRASAFSYVAKFFRHRQLLGLPDMGIGFGSARIQLGLQSVG